MNLDDVAMAAKTFIEIGDIYRVSEDWYITTKAGDPIGVVVGKNNAVPIRVLHDNMEVGDFRILNPFVETSAASKERTWFFNAISVLLGGLAKQALIKLIESSLNTDDESIQYKNLPLVIKYMKKVDKKMLSELKEIGPMSFLFVHYNKKEKTASLQSKVLTDIDTFNIRKKSKEVFQDFLIDILGTDDVTIPEFSYKAQIRQIQQLDATLNVFGQVLDRIAPHVSALTNVTFDLNMFHKHKEQIEAYSKFTSWCVSSVPQDVEKGAEPESEPPWGVEARRQGLVPVTQQAPVSEASRYIAATDMPSAPLTQQQPYLSQQQQQPFPQMGMQQTSIFNQQPQMQTLFNQPQVKLPFP